MEWQEILGIVFLVIFSIVGVFFFLGIMWGYGGLKEDVQYWIMKRRYGKDGKWRD